MINYICLHCGELFYKDESETIIYCPVCDSDKIICENDSDGYDERF